MLTFQVHSLIITSVFPSTIMKLNEKLLIKSIYLFVLSVLLFQFFTSIVSLVAMSNIQTRVKHHGYGRTIWKLPKSHVSFLSANERYFRKCLSLFHSFPRHDDWKANAISEGET